MTSPLCVITSNVKLFERFGGGRGGGGGGGGARGILFWTRETTFIS